MNVFVDTGPLYALAIPQDQCHKKALKLSSQLEKYNTHLITSDYIIDEVFTRILSDIRGGHYRVKEFDNHFLKTKLLQIQWITPGRFEQARLLLLKISKDKAWSFTDCTSFVVMKELKIKTAFTFDDHFKQMGFDVL